ncbi:hypothetical protein HK103_001895 [Boothiomyces macroporosus]|uniref:Uncharacterized protein n=1 Tax=Boothiomyces macroporosus TaxID=261099 RepID=A0AAD5Y2T4_9FUNG|nr:hypothetical protein HK103_001895 [Boothiomyces macroporosus]
MLLLLWNFAAADLIMEGQYFSKYCQGPPDSIYLFETVNTYSYIQWSPSLNETWAPYFKFHSYEASVGDYGNVYVSIPGQNCIESVKYESSTPYWSGYSLFYSSGYGLDTIPKLANGYQYCYLVSNNFNDTSTLRGYKASYYRPNDNTCYDDYYKCSSTGVFSFYPNAGCSGSPETISMPSILTPIISPHLGNISVQLYTVTGASLFFSWTTVIPSEDIVPTFDNVGDWFALLFTIITLGIGLYMCYHTYVAVKKAKKLLFTQISNIVAQTFWMTYYIGCTIFWSLVATNVYIIGGISQANSVTFGVATFLGCLLTSYLVSDVLLYEKRELLRIINPIVLIAIHVGFFGANYGGIFILNVGPPVYTIAQIQLVNAWRKYAIFWTLFVFTFNSVVPIMVAFKLIKIQMQKKAHKEINLIDPNLKFYIIGQILTFAMNAIMFIVKNYTYLLGNDLAFNNTNPYNIFTWAVHSFLTTKIYEVISSSAKYLQKAGTVARSSYQTGQDHTSSVAPIKGNAPRTNE